MKKCIIVANCQGGASKDCLKYSSFYDTYSVEHHYANWELLKGDKMAIPIHQLQNADLVIFQPLSDVHGCYSTNKDNEESFLNLLNDTCKTVSFPRIHNNAVFPIFHKNRSTPNELYGKYNNSVSSLEELYYLYDHNLLDFDFTNRVAQNYAVSKEKEETCDVKIADYVFSNLHKEKLFLTHDHPANPIMNEVAKQMCDHLELDYQHETVANLGENWLGFTDSVYHRPDQQYPISRYAMQHFGFQYIRTEHPDAHEFYKSIITQYFYQTN
uniref:Polysaccharide biosynthesis enzyme WcbI domain-containing protein n=1 Tax=viral metagenome TaxID=1070528 RepID=A0A6C0I2A8_9ZZZZ